MNARIADLENKLEVLLAGMKRAKTTALGKHGGAGVGNESGRGGQIRNGAEDDASGRADHWRPEVCGAPLFARPANDKLASTTAEGIYFSFRSMKDTLGPWHNTSMVWCLCRMTIYDADELDIPSEHVIFYLYPA